MVTKTERAAEKAAAAERLAAQSDPVPAGKVRVRWITDMAHTGRTIEDPQTKLIWRAPRFAPAPTVDVDANVWAANRDRIIAGYPGTFEEVQ